MTNLNQPPKLPTIPATATWSERFSCWADADLANHDFVLYRYDGSIIEERGNEPPKFSVENTREIQEMFLAMIKTEEYADESTHVEALAKAIKHFNG